MKTLSDHQNICSKMRKVVPSRRCIFLMSFVPLLVSIPQLVFAEPASLGPAIAKKTQMVVKESTGSGEQRKEEFIRKLQTKLDEFDFQLEKLKTQGDDLRDKAKSKLFERLESLQAEKDQLLPEIEKATRMSEAAWEDIKGGLDRAAMELKVALEQAASNFF